MVFVFLWLAYFTSFALLVGMQIGAATVKSSMEIPQKVKMELPSDPGIPLLGIYLKKPETLIWENICTPMFIAMLLTIAKIRKQPKCLSADEWIMQLWYLYTTEYHLAIKKKKILSFVTTWLDLETIMLSEINQTGKDKCHMILLIYGI